LPELAGELQNLLKETESQISKLPAAPSDDAQGEVILLVSHFTRELATYVEGTPDDNGIHQAIRPLNKAFVAEIRGTAQKFSPFVGGRGGHYIHPKFLPSEKELSPAPSKASCEEGSFWEGSCIDGDDEICIDGDDEICVDEVMDMANK
jgi:hypothetical protein